MVESKYFLLIISPGFERSNEIKKEISLAKKSANKDFVYFRHKDVSPYLKISLNGEELDIGKQQQIRFETKEDLLRKALVTIGGKIQMSIMEAQEDNVGDKAFIAAISNFAAFYDQEFGARKIQKVYPKLFTPEEMTSPGKADKICRVLETFMENKVQFKRAMQTIINLHQRYSKANIGALRDIIGDLGFVVNDDLFVTEKVRPSNKEETIEIVKKYHDAILDEESSDPLPFKACPQCGSTKLKRSSRQIMDDFVLFIECTDCHWMEAQEM